MPTENNTIIECKDVAQTYGKFGNVTKALDGVDWEVKAGEVMALIGPNGSGKSTLLNILLGLHPPTRGDVSVLGYTPWQQRAKLTSDVTFVSDVALLPKWVSIQSLVNIMYMVQPRFRRDYFFELLDFVKISPKRECSTFSKGQLAYVHLSLALAVDAPLLILDEPTLGLDVAARRHFHTRLLVDYCKGGHSLVVTTHYPDELIGLVTHASFLTDGKLLLADSVEGLAERFQVVNVANSDREHAEKFKPVYQQPVLGGMQMLFDLEKEGVPSDLSQLGAEVSGATLSDVYLAVLDRRESVLSL